ncbi:MAG: hypothetical protein KGZ72_09550 [Roseovarius sp.]|jgi:hypothetical protein|nr:hypothetical protein [Roseovarius sp.]
MTNRLIGCVVDAPEPDTKVHTAVTLDSNFTADSCGSAVRLSYFVDHVIGRAGTSMGRLKRFRNRFLANRNAC